jgi:hypothetical protein
MGNVRLRHDEAVIAGFGDPTTARSAAMNRRELADPIAPANFSFRRLAGKLQILRRQTNRDKREYLRFVANPSAAVDDAMAVDFDPLAQYHFIADYGKRADATARSDLGIWTNDRSGMDLH